MQVSGVFPELNSGRMKSKAASKPKAKAKAKSMKQAVADDIGTSGQSSFASSTRIRPIRAPKTLMGRRSLAHAKAYPD